MIAEIPRSDKTQDKDEKKEESNRATVACQYLTCGRILVCTRDPEDGKWYCNRCAGIRKRAQRLIDLWEKDEKDEKEEKKSEPDDVDECGEANCHNPCTGLFPGDKWWLCDDHLNEKWHKKNCTCGEEWSRCTGPVFVCDTPKCNNIAVYANALCWKHRQDEDEDKDEEKEEKKKKAKSKPKSDTKQVTQVPRVRAQDLKKGEIVANITYRRVEEAGVREWDSRPFFAATLLRAGDRSGDKFTVRSAKPIQWVSTSRYNKVVEMTPTELADKFITCTAYPLRVSFHPILTPKKLADALHDYDIPSSVNYEADEFRDLSESDRKKAAKELMETAVRTMDCRILEPNTSLGYSRVDELVGDKADLEWRTVSHHAIQQFCYMGTLYKRKGSTFQDPKLKEYSVE